MSRGPIVRAELLLIIELFRWGRDIAYFSRPAPLATLRYASDRPRSLRGYPFYRHNKAARFPRRPRALLKVVYFQRRSADSGYAFCRVAGELAYSPPNFFSTQGDSLSMYRYIARPRYFYRQFGAVFWRSAPRPIRRAMRCPL